MEKCSDSVVHAVIRTRLRAIKVEIQITLCAAGKKITVVHLYMNPRQQFPIYYTYPARHPAMVLMYENLDRQLKGDERK